MMQCILHDKIQIAKAVNVQVISLDAAPGGYEDFDKGAAKKYVIDPSPAGSLSLLDTVRVPATSSVTITLRGREIQKLAIMNIITASGQSSSSPLLCS